MATLLDMLKSFFRPTLVSILFLVSDEKSFYVCLKVLPFFLAVVNFCAIDVLWTRR